MYFFFFFCFFGARYINLNNSIIYNKSEHIQHLLHFSFTSGSVTYPKHECLRPCPKPGGCPFLANLGSLFIVPFARTGMTKGNNLDKGNKSSETSELKTQTLALVPSKAVRLGVESMRLVKRWTKSSQNSERFLMKMQTQILSSQVKDIFLFNPSRQCAGKPAPEIFCSCAWQASTRLAWSVMFIYSVQRNKWRELL